MRTHIRARTAGACFAAIAAVALAACGDDQPTEGAPVAAAALSLSIDNSTGTAIALTPGSATIVMGQGTFLQARILDAAGQPVPGARAEWRSTNPAVAGVTPMADSGLVRDHGRAAVFSASTGTTMIIARYDDVADTATITVVPRTDPVPTTPPERARTFDLTVRVQGVLATNAGGDSASRHQRLPGSTVTVTLLPLQAGDSVATGTTPVTAPTVVGTAVTDAQGQVRFTGLTVSRYRIAVTPPSGTSWTATTTEHSPPYWGQMFNEVWLRRP